MAQYKSVKFAAPKLQRVDGNVARIVDKVVPLTLAANDTFDWLLPKGIEYSDLIIQADDIESTTTSLFRLGFVKLPGGTIVDNDQYFAAAGQPRVRAGGRMYCAFKPITFEEDVMLRLTINTGGTWQAGEVFAIAVGSMVGLR